MSTTVADPRELLTFPDVPRLELEETLVQLTERAADVLKAQGRLRELLRANALVTADLKLDVVLRRVVHAARDLVGAKYAALGVLGEDGLLDQFVHAGMPQGPTDQLGRPPVGEGILGLLVDEPGPVRLRDVNIDPRAIGFPAGHPAMTSFLGVPIRVRGAVFGNLYLTESERGEFSDEDEQLVTSLARTAAVAIENARLYEDSERRRRWQGVTTDATQALFAGGHDRPLNVVLEGARQGAEADVTIFADLDDDEVVTAELVVGELVEELVGRNSHASLSTLEPVLRHGTPLLVENYRSREGDPPLDPPIASLIAVPMLRGQRVVGAVVAIRLQGRRAFDHTDVEQLEAYVGHAAVALELNQSRADKEALAVLREHQRIAADLHDHVIQELFATGMALQGMVYRTEDPRDQANLVEFVDAIDATIRRIRTTIFRLNRAPYGGGSLKERLLSVVEDARPALGFTAHAEFSGPLDQGVPEELADHVVAVAREALSNAARHAAARSLRLRVTLAQELLTVDAIDDGRGIGTPTRSSGLANLERRAKEYDGTLEILEPDRGGTHLRWTAAAQLRPLSGRGTFPGCPDDVPDGTDQAACSHVSGSASARRPRRSSGTSTPRPSSGSTASRARLAAMPSTSPRPPTTAEPMLPPTRNSRVAIPSATPRTSTCTASPTDALRAGWPRPNATVTRATATASTGGDVTELPSAASPRATEAITPATASEGAAPIRSSSGPATRGASRPATALGSSSSPTCQGSQPARTSTAGTAISSANHDAGTAAAATAERTTVVLPITETGRKPCGRRRTRSATAGTPSTSRAEADGRDHEAGRRRLHQQYHPAAVPATSTRTEHVEPGAAALAGQRVPQQRQQQHAEHRQRDHLPPAEQLDQATTGQRAEAADRGGDAGDPAERGGLHRPVVAAR